MHTETQRPPANSARLGPIAGLTAAGLLGLCLWKAGDAGAQGAQDAKLQAYGRHLAQECTGCHRIDGVDNGIPSIIGWKADTFIATVKFYQSGARTNPVMVSVANSLNEKQLEALATYFGSLPKPAPQGKRPGR
jgi:cytochrome c553